MTFYKEEVEKQKNNFNSKINRQNFRKFQMLGRKNKCQQY